MVAPPTLPSLSCAHLRSVECAVELSPERKREEGEKRGREERGERERERGEEREEREKRRKEKGMGEKRKE